MALKNWQHQFQIFLKKKEEKFQILFFLINTVSESNEDYRNYIIMIQNKNNFYRNQRANSTAFHIFVYKLYDCISKLHDTDKNQSMQSDWISCKLKWQFLWAFVKPMNKILSKFSFFVLKFYSNGIDFGTERKTKSNKQIIIFFFLNEMCVVVIVAKICVVLNEIKIESLNV